MNFDLSMELPNVGAQPVLDRLAADPGWRGGAVRSGVVDVSGRSIDAFSIEPSRVQCARSCETGASRRA